MLNKVHCPVHVQLQTLESHHLAFYEMKASKDLGGLDNPLMSSKKFKKN